MTNRIKEDGLWVFFCFILAFGFCSFFSISTSFLYTSYGNDSAIFQVIGKGWARGILPYIGLWDHKGPLIFFISKMGYLFSNDGRTGIFIIQVINLTAFAFFVNKTCRLRYSPILSSLLTIASLLWLSCSYSEGNLTEEYVIPWIAAQIYYVARWSLNPSRGEQPYTIIIPLLGGLVLGIAFMSRLTNALSSCGIVFTFFLYYLIKRQFKRCLIIVLSVLTGVVIVCAPFFVYFSAKHITSDMLYGTLFYNFQYISDSSFSLQAFTRKIAFSAFPAFVAGLFAILNLFFGCRLFAALSLSGLVPLVCWLATSTYYVHYAMLFAPSFVMLPLFAAEEKLSSIARSIKLCVLTLFISFPCYYTFRKHNYYFEWFAKTDYICKLTNETFLSIPENGKDSFVGYNVPPSLYLYGNCIPAVPFFTLQDWQCSKSQKLSDIMKDKFYEQKPEWILSTQEIKEEWFQRFLTGYYEPYSILQNETFIIWHCKALF